MSSTAENYFKALLALSGNTTLADARKSLFNNMKDRELKDTITHGLTKQVPRVGLEEIAIKLLDMISREQEPSADTGDRGNSTSKGQGTRKHARSASDGLVKENVHRREANVRNESTPKATARTFQSSMSNRKRAHQVLRRSPRKKHKSISLEASDDEEEMVKVELSSNDEGTNELSSDEEGTIDLSEDTENEAYVLSSWQDVKKLSVMVDLVLGESDDEDDPDYTEDMADTELRCGGKLFAPVFFRMPIIEVVLWHPGKSSWGNFSDLPMTTVRLMVEKFNEDFLKIPKDRRACKRIVKESDSIFSSKFCVGNCLRKKAKTAERLREGTLWACDDCIAGQQLCASFQKLKENVKAKVEWPVELAIYPLPGQYRIGAAWGEMAYWVCE